MRPHAGALLHDGLNERKIRDEYVFSAMAWLSVATITCWVAWLLVSGCGISSVQDQGSSTSGAATRSEPGARSEPAQPSSREVHTTTAHAGAEPPAERVALGDLARQLAAAAGVEVALGPEAEGLSRCVTVAVAAGPRGAEQLRAALRAGGFVVDEAGPGLLVRTDPEVLFLGCGSGRAPSPLTSRDLQELERRVRVVSRQERELPREVFVEVGLALARTAADQDRAVPYFRGGEMVGVKVYSQTDRGVPALLGLRDGDVITHVDGQALTAPGSAVRISGGQDKVVVRVLREGAAVDLQYDLVRPAPTRVAAP